MEESIKEKFIREILDMDEKKANGILQLILHDGFDEHGFPYDDEPLTPEEEVAIKEAKEDFKNGRTYSLGEVFKDILVSESDRDELTGILLKNKGKDILSSADEILSLVPEMVICRNCKHEHIAHKFNNVYTHILHVVAGTDNDLTLKLSALFHDIGKPYCKKKVNGNFHYWGHEKVSEIIAKLVLNRLDYDEKITIDVCSLIRIHDKKINPTINDIEQIVNDIGNLNFERLLKLQMADLLAHANDYAERKIPRLNEIREIYNKL